MFWRFAAYGFLKNLRLFEPFLILFFREQGLTFLQIGILYTVRELTTNLLDVPTGVLADTVGRRVTMVLSMLTYLLSFALFTLTSSFYPFALAMFLYGLGDALRSGTHKALILAYLKMRGWSHLKVEYYGGTRSWSQRGSAVNVLLAALLVFLTHTYRWVFALSSIPYVINLVNLATYPPALDRLVKRKRREGRLPILQIFSFLKSGDYVRVLLNSSVYMGLFRATKDYLQPVLKGLALALPVLLYLNGQERTALLVGIVYGVIYILNSIASENAYRLRDLLRKREGMAVNLTYAAGSLSVLLAGLTFHLSLKWLSVLMFLLLYLIQNVRRPITLAYISDTVPEDTVATALSVESSLRTLYAGLLAPVIGYLADTLGVGLALAMVGSFTLLLLPLVWVRDRVGSP